MKRGLAISRFRKTLDFLSASCIFLSSISLVLLVITFGWLVFGRYILNATPTWVEQLSLLLIIIITFLSSAAGIHERTHLSVDIVPMMCSTRIAAYLRIFAAIVLAIFGVLMAWQAKNLVAFGWTKEIPLLNIPEGIRYIPVLVSGVLVALFSVGNIIFQFDILKKERQNTNDALAASEVK